MVPPSPEWWLWRPVWFGICIRLLLLLVAVFGRFEWFSAPAAGARLLRPVCTRPGAWQVLDAGIAPVMVVLAVGLLRGA